MTIFALFALFYEIIFQVPKKYDKFQISMGPDLTFQISDNDDDMQVRICCTTYLWFHADFNHCTIFCFFPSAGD